VEDVKLIRYKKIDAPHAHFDYSSLFSDAQVEKVGNREKMRKLKELSDENQTECHGILSQIC
jgi:hypothetical protein